jgi:hypothetical protein
MTYLVARRANGRATKTPGSSVSFELPRESFEGGDRGGFEVSHSSEFASYGALRAVRVSSPKTAGPTAEDWSASVRAKVVLALELHRDARWLIAAVNEHAATEGKARDVSERPRIRNGRT